MTIYIKSTERLRYKYAKFYLQLIKIVLTLTGTCMLFQLKVLKNWRKQSWMTWVGLWCFKYECISTNAVNCKTFIIHKAKA